VRSEDDEDEIIFDQGRRAAAANSKTKTEARTRPAKKKSAAFSLEWAKFPKKWEVALRQTTNASTYRLALAVLFEAAELEIKGRKGEKITLSSALTGMTRNARLRATQELTKLGLLETELNGNKAPRVLPQHIY
jgi:hypothetical protein